MRKGDFLFNDIIKGLHLPLACAMLLLVFCLPSAAWEGAADTKWYDDAPTAASYAISTAEEFAGLAALVNAASCDFEGKTITLSGDIDLSGRQWRPIGDFSTTPVKAFEGTLDGGGNTIKNLTISGTGTSAALFGYIGVSGVVKNITVTGSIAIAGDYVYLAGVADINRGVIERCENRAAVTGTLIMESVGENSYCAGIAARNYGRISSCLNNARVEGGAAAGISCENGGYFPDGLYQAEKAVIEGCENSGEIIGKVNGRATTGGIAVTANSYTLKNCINRGPVKGRGNSAVGGIAAETDSRTDATSSIDGCVNSGSVTLEGDGSGSGVGGIVGGTDGITKILNCRNTGNISGPNAPVGGITGRLGGDYGTVISNCVNSGTITSSYIDNESYAGGIAAINFLLIEDCANFGDIFLSGSGDSQNWIAAGGVAGANRGNSGTIRRCTSAGNVESFSTYMGGITGYNKAHDPQDDEGNITECAWLDTSAQRAAGDAETTAGARSFTSEQQQRIVTACLLTPASATVAQNGTTDFTLELFPGTGAPFGSHVMELSAAVTPDNIAAAAIKSAVVAVSGKSLGSAEMSVRVKFCPSNLSDPEFGPSETPHEIVFSAGINVVERIPAAGITLDKSAASLRKGETLTLAATVTPADSTDAVIWASGSPEAASVADGKVTAHAPGTAVITARAGKFSAECMVTVIDTDTTAGSGGCGAAPWSLLICLGAFCLQLRKNKK